MLVRNSTLVGREIPQCKCIRSKFFALSGPSASTGRKGVFSSVARRTRPVEGVEGRGGGVEKQERRRGKRETERKGGRGCEGDRQTDRQTDRGRETDRERQTGREAERQRVGSTLSTCYSRCNFGFDFCRCCTGGSGGGCLEFKQGEEEERKRGGRGWVGGREGGTVRQRERQRQRRRGIVFCGSVLRQLPTKK